MNKSYFSSIISRFSPPPVGRNVRIKAAIAVPITLAAVVRLLVELVGELFEHRDGTVDTQRGAVQTYLIVLRLPPALVGVVVVVGRALLVYALYIVLGVFFGNVVDLYGAFYAEVKRRADENVQNLGKIP